MQNPEDLVYPLTMQLTHKISSLFLNIVPCQMAVMQDRLEISGNHLNEPVTVQRPNAQKQVKLGTYKMVIRSGNGRKYHLHYPATESDLPLKLARLDAWMGNKPDDSAQDVDHCLKKWACRKVAYWYILMPALAVILVMVSALQYAVTLNAGFSVDEIGNEVIERSWNGAVVLAITIPIIILLWRGWMGILYPFIGLVIFNIITLWIFIVPSGSTGTAIGAVIATIIGGIYLNLAVKALRDYKRLRRQVGGQ